jgi:succinate dehydrogenase / fumarate reductase flavoprotein subunit
MEICIVALLKDGDRVVGAFGTIASAGGSNFSRESSHSRHGGIGKAYKITSNSWDCTGDGHSLAYHAGADVDRHGVRAISSHRHGLAAERRGNARDRRRARRRRDPHEMPTANVSCSISFPTTTKRRRAITKKKGWRYTQGDKNARRPPELLTRDHVARCIVREIKEGRGTPHGGVYLDIPGSKKNVRTPRTHQTQAAEHVSSIQSARRYRYYEGADGGRPTTHYIMGGVHVNADTQMSDVPGLFAAGECAAGINGANRLGGNSLSDLCIRKTRRRIRGEIREGEFHWQIDNDKIDTTRAKR